MASSFLRGYLLPDFYHVIKLRLKIINAHTSELLLAITMKSN